MFKVLLIALYILLTLSAPAHAGPVFAAVGFVAKAVAGFAASSWIGSVLVAVGKSVVVGLLNQTINKLFGKNQKQEAIGIVLRTQSGDDLPLSFVVGKRATAGKRKYWGTWGEEDNTPNAYFVDVLEIGAIPSYAGPQGIKALFVGDKKATILWTQPHPDGRGYPVEEYRKDGKDHCWVKYLDGSQTVADPYLRAKFGTMPERPYTEEMIGIGKQVLIITCRFNADVWSGNPDILVEPAPVRFYDPRKDTTAGGNGSHRWGYPATYEPTENPAIIIYNIVRGIQDMRGEWLYGGQDVSAYRWTASNAMAAANECDRIIDGRPQFRCGAEIFLDEEPLAVIEQFRLACNGRFILSGGTVRLLVGAPGAAVWAFNDTHIIRSDDSEMDPWPSLSETHNTITANYPDPDSRWAMKDAPEYSVEVYIKDDARKLSYPLSFRAVPDGRQVQALQRTLIEDGRRFIIHELTLPPVARLLEGGDVVAWTSAYNNYTDKLFFIERITRMRGSRQRVVLKELEPTDYDPPVVIIPPTPTPIGPIETPTQPMYGWSIVPATITDELGRPRRASVRVTCAPDQDDVTHIHVQLRIRGTEEVIYDSDSTPYGSPYSWIIQAQLPNDTHLEGRGRFVPGTQRTTKFGEWLAVKTDDIRLNHNDLFVELEAVRGNLKEVLKNVTRIYDQHNDLVEQLAAATAVGAGQNFNTSAAVVKTSRALAASYIQQTAKIEELNGVVTATAGLIAGVSAKVDDVSADGLLSISANTNPGNGALVEIIQSARAEVGGETARGSHIIRVLRENGALISEQIFTANRCIFVSEDGGVVGVPIVIENGMLKLAVGRIGKAIVDELVAENGKWSLRGSNGKSDFRWWS